MFLRAAAKLRDAHGDRLKARPEKKWPPKGGQFASSFQLFGGRGERIRTSDPLHPMQVRYQAAPRPDRI
jgi:hypothetical protein